MLRQQHLQPAVTYVYVSSLVCKFASLPCRLFQPLQSVDFVNALRIVIYNPFIIA